MPANTSGVGKPEPLEVPDGGAEVAEARPRPPRRAPRRRPTAAAHPIPARRHPRSLSAPPPPPHFSLVSRPYGCYYLEPPRRGTHSRPLSRPTGAPISKPWEGVGTGQAGRDPAGGGGDEGLGTGARHDVPEVVGAVVPVGEELLGPGRAGDPPPRSTSQLVAARPGRCAPGAGRRRGRGSPGEHPLHLGVPEGGGPPVTPVARLYPMRPSTTTAQPVTQLRAASPTASTTATAPELRTGEALSPTAPPTKQVAAGGAVQEAALRRRTRCPPAAQPLVTPSCITIRPPPMPLPT